MPRISIEDFMAKLEWEGGLDELARERWFATDEVPEKIAHLWPKYLSIMSLAIDIELKIYDLLEKKDA